MNEVRYFDANKGFGFLEVLEDIRFRNEPSARLGMGGDLYVSFIFPHWEEE